VSACGEKVLFPSSKVNLWRKTGDAITARPLSTSTEMVVARRGRGKKAEGYLGICIGGGGSEISTRTIDGTDLATDSFNTRLLFSI
jgi:hypothetical protein